eukprot:182179-Pleurochrysis_carterae.AAC.1
MSCTVDMLLALHARGKAKMRRCSIQAYNVRSECFVQFHLAFTHRVLLRSVALAMWGEVPDSG